jgi:hypothetical protein
METIIMCVMGFSIFGSIGIVLILELFEGSI